MGGAGPGVSSTRAVTRTDHQRQCLGLPKEAIGLGKDLRTFNDQRREYCPQRRARKHYPAAQKGARCVHEFPREGEIVELQARSVFTIDMYVQLLFLWPTDELSIKDLLGPQLEAFDPIRREFRAHLYLSPDLPDYICVAGYERDIMREIVHLIRVKWNELMASTNIKSKLYVVEPPEPDFMRGRISIKTNHHQLAKPILDGGLLKGAQLADWDGRATLIRSKNDIRILGATEQALKGLAFFRGYLQMRVNFGTFVLDEYRLAKDGRPGYSFETFREMLLYEKTRGRLLPG
jgi:hypothetical protein